MKCVRDCPSDAIDIENGSINSTCIHCGHCVAICPESTVFPELEKIKKLNPSKVTPDTFQDLSAGIRTCRSYLDREVDEQTLSLLIDNMKHYPSASNARPLEITILKTPEVIERVNHQTANVLIKAIRMITSPVLMPVLHILAPKLGLRRLKAYKKQFIARTNPRIIPGMPSCARGNAFSFTCHQIRHGRCRRVYMGKLYFHICQYPWIGKLL